MRSILVTGGAGFIGANFVHYWLKHHRGDRVVVLDALTYAGNLASLEPAAANDAYRFVKGDILDTQLATSLIKEEGVDTIVHFAAESHVDRSITGPSVFVDTNVVGTHNLLQAAKACWLDSDDAPSTHRFHHVSTDEVFGSLGKNDPAFNEMTPYAPNSPYSASKAASDHLVRSYFHTFGLRVSTSNCSNNYGPYQFPEKLIPLMIVYCLEGRPLPVYGDGSNIRDWLYVEDYVRGIELVLLKGRIGETYNFGGNEERSNIDVVAAICAMIDEVFANHPDLIKRFPDAPAGKGLSTESLITFVTDRPGHDWRYAIDATKSESELGFYRSKTFESGMQATLEWMLANEAWWRAIVDGSYRESVASHYGGARRQ